MANEFSKILTPLKIGGVEIKNRLVIAPMGDGYLGLSGPHAEYSDLGIEHIVTRARGGWGLNILGCTMFPDNKVDAHDPIYSILDHQGQFMKQGQRLNELCSVYDMKNFQQVTMGWGRTYENCYTPSGGSVSPVFGDPSHSSPMLTREQIAMKIDAMVQMALLCKNSGFAGIEIHALHWGYLMDQFAMSLTNKREDEYGGSLENRLRVCKEAVEGIKQACGSAFPVTMRLGLKSYIKDVNTGELSGEHEAGRTLEESLRIAKLLEAYGYDCLNVDVGVYESFFASCPPSYMPHGHVIDMAAEVKKVVDIPVICGSRMNDPFMNEQAIADGKIDAAVLGRQSLADPFYAKKIEMGQPEKIRPCIGCLVGCLGNLQKGAPVSCAVNPVGRKEGNYNIERSLEPKTVAIIGGGVAGMEAARVCKLRGHEVTIYEKTDHLGGLLEAAGAPSFKQEMLQLLSWYKEEIKELEIPVVFNTELSADKLIEMKPDAVIQAMGSGSLMPGSIKGIDTEKVISFIDAHQNKDAHKDDKKIIIVGGGLVGCETALDFAMDGKDVTIIEALPTIMGSGLSVPVPVKQMIPQLLEQYGVKIKTSYKIDEVNEKGAIVTPGAGGASELLEADKVIIAIGRRKAAPITQDLYGTGIMSYSIGDMNAVGNVYTCVTAAYEVARSI